MKSSQTDLRRQVGQLLIMGFDGVEADARLRALLSSLEPGGVILFTRNIASAKQCYDLTAECRKAALGNAPLFTCVDLEGGTVDRFRQAIAPAPSEFEVASTGSWVLFRCHGELLATEARTLGFNTDFAPVSDIGFETSRSVLGSRTVSSNPKETAAYVREFLRGMKSADVLGCGKHFPGLGDANLDTHHELPAVSKSWKKLWEEDLLPYRALHRQFPFVMVAHAAYPAVTGEMTPASLSKKWMTGILRKRIGYRGIILSDDLEMGGVLAASSIEDAAIETLRAGADMFLVCHSEQNVRSTFEAVLREAERNRRFARVIAQASARVTAFKKRSPALKTFAPPPTNASIARLRGEIERFRNQLAKAHKVL